MSKNIFDSFKNMFKGKNAAEESNEADYVRVNVTTMEEKYQEDDLVGAASILVHILEVYGEKKSKNHRLKGREFIHLILSRKHKDLKTIGYTHWENINKVIHLNQAKPYPYHKKNLRKAMDFYVKEIKGIKIIDTRMY